MTPQQCKAARALLYWSGTELANRALVGISTVRNFESDLRDTTTANIAAMKHALEKGGVVFIDEGKFIGVKIKR